MACTPFSIGVGLFDNSTGVWKQDAGASKGGKTVTRTVSGTTVTYSWTGPTGPGFQSATAPNQVKYQFVGTSNTLLVLFSQILGSSATHYVSIIDFTTTPPTQRNVLTGSSTGTGSQPRVEFSLPDGNAVLVYSSGSTGEIENLAIYRGDNAALLLPGFGPYTPTGETEGEATATKLRIHYSTGGTSKVLEGPLPAGSAHITPSPLVFPQAIVGGPALTAPVTIRNNGTDCLLINSISSVAPFSVPPTTTSLSPGATTTVTVSFSPTAPGSTGSVSLPVSRTPANGDAAIVCSGTARAPVKSMGVSSTSLSFGTIPVTTSKTASLTVRNNGAVGDLPINVTIAAQTSGPFTWPAYSGTLAPTMTASITVTFLPTAAGPASSTLVVSSDAPTSPVNVALSGAGCVPTAQIALPPPPFPSFGNVERGFRLVRTISVQNLGSGPLSFDAHIIGPDATLFGLPLDTGPITDMPGARSFNVNPITACGALATGTGSIDVAVEFFANDVPRSTSATLVIDNATDAGASSWSFPLNATITAPSPIDAIAVFDHSGSMADLVGVRTKSEAAIRAGQLFVELLSPDANNDIALVRFNQTPDLLQAMTPLTAANQATVEGQLNSTSLSPSGSTSIAGGAMLGLTQTTRSVPSLRKAMVVLTDGMDNYRLSEPRRRTVLQHHRRICSNLPIRRRQHSPNSDWLRCQDLWSRHRQTSRHRHWQTQHPFPGHRRVLRCGRRPGRGELLRSREVFHPDLYGCCQYHAAARSGLHDSARRNADHRIRRAARRRVGARGRLRSRWPEDSFLPSHTSRRSDRSCPRAGWFLSPVRHYPNRALRRSSDAGSRTGPLRRSLAGGGQASGYVCFEQPARERRGTKSSDRQIGFISRECKPIREDVMYGLAIGIGSNFRMQPYVSPGIVKVGEPIVLAAVVSEAGLPVLGCRVSALATSPTGVEHQVVLFDDGAHQDGDANNGQYACAFLRTDEEGSYTFTFRAVGRSRGGEPVLREATRSQVRRRAHRDRA